MSNISNPRILPVMREALGELGIPAPMEHSGAAFPVLVSTIISLRTRDSTTRTVSEQLLKEAPDPDSLLAIDTKRLEELLRPAGFFRQKAAQLKKIAKILKRDFHGEVPDNLKDLISLPGVGRKTANFVLGMVFGKPAICVDVHVHRISNRLGLVSTRDPGETELALQEIFPGSEWISINHTMVRFGQRICRPVRPLCDQCPFADSCPSSEAMED